MTDRENTSHTKWQNVHPTVGFFVHSISDSHGSALWPGIMDGARDHNADTICFKGNNLESPVGFQGQGNVIFQLANTENLDGLIFSSATLSLFVNESTMQAFVDKYRSLPRVSLGVPLKGVPSLTVENYQGMRDVVSHLIEAHGKRRIVYINGPADNPEAQLRYRAYVDALTEHGIPLDPALVSAPTEWSEVSGKAVLSAIMDQRGLQPGQGFDAVAASNDETAIGVISMLQERGFLVPDDVAVTGFDGFARGEFCSPPLTSVRQPVYEQAYAAVELILAQIRGEKVPLETCMSTVLVIRQSCGCSDPTVAQAAAGSTAQITRKAENGENLVAVLEAQYDSIQADMIAAAGASFEHVNPLWPQQLMSAFTGDLTGQTDHTFLSTLDRLIQRAMMSNADLNIWHNIISAHRRSVLPLLIERKYLNSAEDLWQQARVVIAGIASRLSAAQQAEEIRKANTLRQIGETLITTFDLANSMDALSQDLPQLGIPGCYLSLYDFPDQPDKWSNLIFAYNEGGRVNVPRGGTRFPSLQLIPHHLRSTRKLLSAVIAPLYFRDQQLGFVVFETGPRSGMIYESLRGQISSMLQGVLLMQQVQQHTAQLDTIVTETLATSEEMRATITETSRQAQSVADTAQQSVTVSKTGQDAVTTTVTGMETIQRQVSDIATSILALSERTQQIGEIINAVEDIADQSRLLALNASIEAARAGEEGLGFAVVAREMRLLAGQSREATNKVSGILNEIQRAANTAVMVTEEGSKGAQAGMELAQQAGVSIQDLTAIIEESARIAIQIAASTRQQTNAMDQLVMAMKSIKQASAQTSASLKEANT